MSVLRALHAVLSIVVPGHALALAGRRVQAGILSAVGLVAHLGFALTFHALWVVLAVGLVGAALGLRALAATPRTWNLGWLFAGGFLVAVLALPARLDKAASTSMAPTLPMGATFRATRVPFLWRTVERGDIVTFAWPCNPARRYVKRVAGIPGDRVAIACGILFIDGHPTPSTRVGEERLVAEEGMRPATVQRYREVLGGHTYDVFHLYPPRDPASVDHDFPSGPLAVPSCEGQMEARSIETTPMQIEPVAPGGACTPSHVGVVPPDHYFVLGDNRENSNDSRAWGLVPIDHIDGFVRAIVWPAAHAGAVE